MANTAQKLVNNSNNFQEFLGYDERGNAVLLRRSTEHPGHPVEAGLDTTKTPVSDAGQPQAERVTGSLRFFSDFAEVKAKLQRSGS